MAVLKCTVDNLRQEFTRFERIQLIKRKGRGKKKEAIVQNLAKERLIFYVYYFRFNGFFLNILYYPLVRKVSLLCLKGKPPAIVFPVLS